MMMMNLKMMNSRTVSSMMMNSMMMMMMKLQRPTFVGYFLLVSSASSFLLSKVLDLKLCFLFALRNAAMMILLTLMNDDIDDNYDIGGIGDNGMTTL